MKITKRIFALMAAACVMSSFALVTNASMHTDKSCSTSNGSYTTNSSDKENVNAGSHTSYMRLRGISYYGMPANTMPMGGRFTLNVANTGTSFTYSSYSIAPQTKSYSVSSKISTYVGISNVNNTGCTAFYDWNPNY